MGKKRLVYNFEIDGIEHIIDVSKPFGAGGNVYYVSIDHFHRGQIVPRPWGLQPYVDLGYLLTGDDLGVIMDDLEELE